MAGSSSSRRLAWAGTGTDQQPWEIGRLAKAVFVANLLWMPPSAHETSQQSPLPSSTEEEHLKQQQQHHQVFSALISSSREWEWKGVQQKRSKNS
jgi:hypothetical protein